MSGELTVAIVAIVIAAPPSYALMWSQIRKDRAAAATALQNRLDKAKEEGRTAALKDQQVIELDQQIIDMGARLRRLEGDE